MKKTVLRDSCFICPSDAIFLGATATFDETIFPHCRSASTPGSTNLGNLPPDQEDHNHSDGTGHDQGLQCISLSIHGPDDDGIWPLVMSQLTWAHGVS